VIDITPDDVSRLNDVQLRELVARLCEAELRQKGYPSSVVTWGGHQNAADDGVDVRVALPAGTAIDGYISRAAAVFQAKAEDLPASAIATEMAPNGSLRSSIADLASIGGAYIIVSSKGSTAEPALKRRRNAMLEAVQGLANANALALDFYDRTRIASWVREHPALILWLRNSIGRSIHGWQPYGAWSYPAGNADAEYLVDGGVTIRPRPTTLTSDISTLEGIATIREKLRAPHGVVRLVGLSGVGKTRFTQALFDGRIGVDGVDSSLVFYTNINDGPDPQPISLASDLVAANMRAVLVVDNCAAELHAALADIAKRSTSRLSVLTIEYDIREDAPWGTDVYELQAASVPLIETLLRDRFPNISQIDARTAAESSGGNARIAIALAGTVERGGTLERLNDDQLFQRLFVQRQPQDKALLRIAQVCALVYSFDGEDTSDGDTGELERLGRMIGASAEEVYEGTAELLRRDLAQRRGPWRAVLPHALANKLAAAALEDIPLTTIRGGLIYGAPERIVKSFSKRLGLLHTSEAARALVRTWFSAHGRLANVWNLDEFHRALFENVLPVEPEAGLAAIERGVPSPGTARPIAVGRQLPRALRSIAYEPPLFERAADLLRLIAIEGDSDIAKTAAGVHQSLFTMYLSGTHASIEQRTSVARKLILSVTPGNQTLGFGALSALLQSMHFTSSHDFQFGTRSRDYGLHPSTASDVLHWYRTAFSLAASIACSKTAEAEQAKRIVANHFRGLWSRVGLRDELTDLATRLTAGEDFWRDGWQSVKQTLNYDEKDKSSDNYARLSALQIRLQPRDLVQRVRGLALGHANPEYELDDVDLGLPGTFATAMERRQAAVVALGEMLARDGNALHELLPEIVTGPGLVWYLGEGLGRGADHPKAIWQQLASQLGETVGERVDTRVFSGMLQQIRERDPNLADELLELTLSTDPLAPYFPAIQSSIGIDQKGIDRLKRSLDLGRASIRSYHHLSLGRTITGADAANLASFVSALAAKPGGQSVAIDILQMQFFLDGQDRRPHAPELIAGARKLLVELDLSSDAHLEDYALGVVVKTCTSAEGGDVVARRFCEALAAAFKARDIYTYYHKEVLDALFKTQPIVALDVFFGDGDPPAGPTVRMIQTASTQQNDPLEQLPIEVVLEWASRDPSSRYTALAAQLNLFRQSGQVAAWNPLFAALVASAPNPIAVLRVISERLRPNHWSGSYASVLESNAQLFDLFEAHGSAEVAAFLEEEKARLLEEAGDEREHENQRDKRRDERFE
jgi:hypothetical protein